MTRRVVLFGLDGATFTVFDDLAKRGLVPNFAAMRARGASGTLRSTTPWLTPPAWTTLVTGRSPGGHGIFNFLQYDSTESPYPRIVQSRNILAKTIWSLVSDAGLSAGSLNFVAHSPAPSFSGYCIPGWVPWRFVKMHSKPAGLIDEIKASLPGFDLQTLAMNFKEEEKAIAGAEIEDYTEWIDIHIKREKQWFGLMKHLMKTKPTELTGIVFDGVDKLQHLLWQYVDPNLTPENPSEAFLRVRDRCFDYYQLIDGFLGETLELVGDDGYVMVASDHGFCGTDEVVYINTFLAQQGFLFWNGAAEVIAEENQELGDAHPYHLTHMDLSNTLAFANSASSNGIYINVKGVRGDEGIDPVEYESVRERVRVSLLRECRDPETGEPLITNVWTREELFGGPNIENAPDLTVELRDKSFFSVLRADRILKKRSAVMGCHHPDGVFLATGPGVTSGSTVCDASLLDVAPTMLHALGLAVPQDMEGRVLAEMYENEFLSQHPVVTCAASNGRVDHGDGADLSEDAESEAQVLMRLKALGYIE